MEISERVAVRVASVAAATYDIRSVAGMNFHKLLVALLALFVAAAAAVGIINADPGGNTGEAIPQPAPDETEMVSRAAELVDELEVAPESHQDDYDRDLFGSGWSQQDGCSTRSRVLIEESTVEPEVTESCTVNNGEWDSWFDAETVTEPGDLDIDHLVPLAEAWASGAHAWSDDERREYANDTDTDRPDALVAVTASSNREKADGDPAEWLPPEAASHCRYVAAWVIQKHSWGLTADPDEHEILVSVLDACTADL